MEIKSQKKTSIPQAEVSIDKARLAVLSRGRELWWHGDIQTIGQATFPEHRKDICAIHYSDKRSEKSINWLKNISQEAAAFLASDERSTLPYEAIFLVYVKGSKQFCEFIVDNRPEGIQQPLGNRSLNSITATIFTNLIMRHYHGSHLKLAGFREEKEKFILKVECEENGKQLPPLTIPLMKDYLGIADGLNFEAQKVLNSATPMKETLLLAQNAGN